MLYTGYEGETRHGIVLEAGRIAGRGEPCRLLVVEVGTVEDAGIQRGHLALLPVGKVKTGQETHVAHVSDLLGDETAVGEKLCRGVAVGIDAEGHTLLAEREAEGLPGCHSHPGVLHLHLALIEEVYLHLVFGTERQFADHGKTGVAYLEATGIQVRLVLEFATQYAVQSGHELGGLALHHLFQPRQAFLHTPDVRAALGMG